MNRVTLEQISGKIKETHYVVLPDGRTTICMLTLENGYTVRGESSCVAIENFDQRLGESMAYTAAVRNVWPLEGYLLAERLYLARKEGV